MQLELALHCGATRGLLFTGSDCCFVWGKLGAELQIYNL